MDNAYFLDLYAYNRWANHRLWDKVIMLSDEQYHQDIDYSIGSVHNHVLHMAAVEGWWFHFLSESDVSWLEAFGEDVEKFGDRAVLRAEWDKVEAFIVDYLNAITDEELARMVKPPFWEGDQHPIPVQGALIQVANHSTDHRSQVLRALHDLGAETFEQDYLRYYWAKKGE